MCSITEAAKANGLNPYWYYEAYVLEGMLNFSDSGWGPGVPDSGWGPGGSPVLRCGLVDRRLKWGQSALYIVFICAQQ